jgi:signal transduction histidine kinase
MRQHKTPNPPSADTLRGSVDLEALCRDVRRLEHERAHFEHASALKSQFLANLSHEFRAPLSAILGYTSMLLGGVCGEVAPPLRGSLERIDNNARHLMGLINEVLDLARIEAGKMPVRVSTFNVGELVDETFAQLEPLIASSSLSVTCAPVGELPPLHSDRRKVKQIVLNLLTNALKFTPAGQVEVRVSYDPDTRESRIAVEDTGIGIAAADLDRIFEDFKQADGAEGGTGLGLAISRHLAQLLGGDLEVASAPRQGSTFTLRLPRYQRAS